jgi:catechol 2,3-dioxygenase-like lactoylglutathione lyase family enzyme
MSLIIHASFLSHDDPERALAFYRDTLGFEVRNDVGYDGKRWITVGPVDQPDTSVVLEPAAGAPGLTDQERDTIAAMMAKGTYGGLLLASVDLDATFERLRAEGVEIAQEPTDQPFGVRDFAVRDPAGNMIRIQQSRSRGSGRAQGGTG